MNNPAFKIIIVEDDQDLRDSIVRYIEDEDIAVTAIGSAHEFLTCLEHDSFDVAVIDIGLPDLSGYVLAEYARLKTDLGIIILTARSKIEERVQGYAAGADLYLVKPVDMQELLAAITSLAKRSAGRSQQNLTMAATWQLCRSTWCLHSPSGDKIELTGKEYELVKLMANANGNVIQRKQLLASLDYVDDEHSMRALNTLLHKLRKKILKKTCLEFPLHTQHAVGYSFSGSIIIK
jgi:two-component system OmpR family response regulator